ncbi:dTDP-4-dehydrorhamnose reductase subunit, NAD(P)-binding, of dTDP-L-rhamnose synthase [Candidatus Nitrosacidococcus tergens]|uniref:dTDP-4-dehydrorhamnose reductase n=1 Tax=Candidatus Nitrosacidococcus tergens TaxID=553981 RepID=A0A7G1QAI9_9GAMM|nr:dTDP-4-dehydrorhamnose reductase [Candidatus Nitrosacidococcus tergens]CAB1276719.1 dTDP-4-dehydrorhamnose reductase subunit, NAD(P)-binding, of dTDP-L-rhamnose synthase [Candidatus Nitrosacidococcus tergens]
MQRTFASLGKIIPLGRSQLDLSKLETIRSCLMAYRPNLIINAAAYTQVDKAEEEQKLAMTVNGTAPGILAEIAKELDAALIHYSTDYVFNGKNNTPYQEGDIPNPINTYGKTKLAGEKAITEIGGNYLIFRTCWVYGLRGHNFLLTMQRLIKEQKTIQVVNDQFGTPTWSRFIAEATAQVIAQTRGGIANYINEYSGIYHLSCKGEISWHEFAQAINNRINLQNSNQAQIIPIPTSDYPTLAKRPRFSCLDNTHIQNTFGITLPDWNLGLDLLLS